MIDNAGRKSRNFPRPRYLFARESERKDTRTQVRERTQSFPEFMLYEGQGADTNFEPDLDVHLCRMARRSQTRFDRLREAQLQH